MHVYSLVENVTEHWRCISDRWGCLFCVQLSTVKVDGADDEDVDEEALEAEANED